MQPKPISKINGVLSFSLKFIMYTLDLVTIDGGRSEKSWKKILVLLPISSKWTIIQNLFIYFMCFVLSTGCFQFQTFPANNVTYGFY